MKIVFMTIITFIIVSSLAFADAGKLYKKCQACHGKSGEKIALKVGAILKGQSKQSILDKLKGYKNKTYGGTKKVMMERQAAKLSDADIDALATYISSF